VLVRIGLRDIPILDFSRIDDVLRRARPAAAQLSRALAGRPQGTAEPPSRPEPDTMP
jgi:hypothetical protein